MSDGENTVAISPSSSQGNVERLHYSDLTLEALVNNHSWEYCDAQHLQNGVKRLFVGIAPDGMMIPNGARYLGVNYSADPESRRYIALHYGPDLLKDWDGREGTPAEIAAKVNEWAVQYSLTERAKLGTA
ncbi:hypothetical protein GOB86_14675 [Acetobacter lambici]|uniref:Uncharacterized protein n=1 Tax=Acetobacter lambici TaxID=1332824 RepID=A0ABT1F6Y8_9PROT|nr:hypothetical protein [Acetobacter lambici]MCP1244092.1 hypothetical protein [Acetobacter lambici]MCP1260034.1 hypothetical protein [Acetobacter lambici]NHO58257.1 hypothetical protein [Acetobacter lambici]